MATSLINCQKCNILSHPAVFNADGICILCEQNFSKPTKNLVSCTECNMEFHSSVISQDGICILCENGRKIKKSSLPSDCQKCGTLCYHSMISPSGLCVLCDKDFNPDF